MNMVFFVVLMCLSVINGALGMNETNPTRSFNWFASGFCVMGALDQIFIVFSR